MHGNSTGYTTIKPSYNSTGSIDLTLPSSTGTLALTSDIETLVADLLAQNSGFKLIQQVKGTVTGNKWTFLLFKAAGAGLPISFVNINNATITPFKVGFFIGNGGTPSGSITFSEAFSEGVFAATWGLSSDSGAYYMYAKNTNWTGYGWYASTGGTHNVAGHDTTSTFISKTQLTVGAYTQFGCIIWGV